MKRDPAHGSDRALDVESLARQVDGASEGRLPVGMDMLRAVLDRTHGRPVPGYMLELHPGFKHVLIPVPAGAITRVVGAQARGPYAIVPDLSGGRFVIALYRRCPADTTWFRVAGFRNTWDAVHAAARILHQAPAWIIPHDGRAGSWARPDDKVLARLLTAGGMEQGRVVGSVSLVWQIRPTNRYERRD